MTGLAAAVKGGLPCPCINTMLPFRRVDVPDFSQQSIIADWSLDTIASQRATEIKASFGQRHIVLLLNVSVYLGEIFVPVCVFGAYEIIAKVSGTTSLNTSKALVTLSILQLLIEPCAMILIALPLSASMLGALGRIQDYLLLPSLSSERETLPRDSAPLGRAGDEDIELTTVIPKGVPQDPRALRLNNVTVKYTAGSASALDNLSCSFLAGCFNILTGPVGSGEFFSPSPSLSSLIHGISGKSTLLKAILQEVPVEGSISRHSSSIAFASQSAWLPNASVQSLICGMRSNAAIDERFYAEVLHACALNQDIEQLADGDRTIIGSRGITLSGGQRQRIALARAVYARKDLILLDDVLSALDASTEQLVVSRLLGKHGLVRKYGATIVLVTHSVRHLSLADNIVVLQKDGTLHAQGNFESLQRNGYLSRDVLSQMQDREEPTEEVVTNTPKNAQGVTNEQKEDLSRKAGDIKIYAYYARSIGWKPLAIFVVCTAGGAFMISFSQVWLQVR